MSSADEKANEVSQEATSEKKLPTSPETDEPVSDAATTESEKKVKEPESKFVGPVILFFLLGFAASLVVGWVIFPKLLYSRKKQPIDFNHVIHNESVAAGCESCHFFREDGSFSGVPKLKQCLECHAEQQGELANEAKFMKEYMDKEVEVPWLVYSRQPDSVFFSHAAHIKMAKMECVTCHGAIGESEYLKVYEENRITGYSRDIWGKNIAGFKRNTWDRMKMDDCAKCHAELTDMSAKKKAKSSMGRLFTNIVNIAFPDSTKTGKKSSVQTEKEACFVCHK
jgi:hypothetical protein